ncbi:uncharacterized protein K441DRAFT_677298 [Cenococcum geophilum 1.58]|uniref:uncharacterized protein n=1 Tax=Cenococcum geophilum 1.58 TaxID=794803 RepID=UPI00358F7579|nr:hypothetical protein K441DRAFT_677298 [Cenococcum geophilum 1.58]
MTSPIIRVSVEPEEQTNVASNQPESHSVRSAGLGIRGINTKTEVEASEQYSGTRNNTPDHTIIGRTHSPASIASQEKSGPLPGRPKSSFWKYLAISLLSTLLSGSYFAIAVWGPVWDSIRDPFLAKQVASITAKVIEISFGSICVLFLGQVLTRRSINRNVPRGVSLDQICMRDWIIDPGSMVGDGKVLELGTKSFLGWYVLVAAIATTLYGTASNSLVQPVLRDVSPRHITVTGTVKTSFANEWYIEDASKNPVQPDARSFLSILYSSKGSDSYSSYLEQWQDTGENHNGSIEQLERRAPSILDRKTLLQCQLNSSWVQSINMQDTFDKFGRVVDNVTLALPHPGVLHAARSSTKSIPQPGEFDGGVGRYKLQASVPSPFLNVLCASADRDEIGGLVYQYQVLQNKGSMNVTADLKSEGSDTYFVNAFDWDKFASVKTPLDGIFDWSENKTRPNTHLHIKRTIWPDVYNNYGRDSIYLLGNSNITPKNYFVCSMQAGLLADCSTELAVAGNASVMTAHCADKNNKMSYHKRDTSKVDTISLDWVAVGSLAATSVGLNLGELDSTGDNPSFMSRLMLTNASLQPAQPSLAEALGAILMPSLLLAAQGSPFSIPDPPSKNFTTTPGTPESFPAQLHPALFVSGGDAIYKKLYISVFLSVLLMNLLMLYYLLIQHFRDGLIVDICDPMNLFGLAASSSFGKFPESQLILSPRAATGAKTSPLSTEWKILNDDNGAISISEVGSIRSAGGTPNDAVEASGFTPLIVREGRGRGRGRGVGEGEIEMV